MAKCSYVVTVNVRNVIFKTLGLKETDLTIPWIIECYIHLKPVSVCCFNRKCTTQTCVFNALSPY